MSRKLVWSCALALFVLVASANAQTRPAAAPQQQAGPPAARVANQPGVTSRAATPAGAPGAAVAPAKPSPPQAPFQLTPAQAAALDQMLIQWEQRSEKVQKFKCQFMRWDYDQTFGSPTNNRLKSESTGVIKYGAPDHGVFRVSDMKEYDAGQGKFVIKKDELDHWVCDGKAIFEFNYGKRQLIERPLPPEMRGKAIADGPLPFIFNAKAETLKRRYFLREITPADAAATQIWLEAYPRYRSDAANFQRVEFILTKADFQPYALQIYLPMGKNRTVYQFSEIVINGFTLLDSDFSPPKTPFNWKRVVEDPNKPQPQFTPEGSTATRPAGTPK